MISINFYQLKNGWGLLIKGAKFKDEHNGSYGFANFKSMMSYIEKVLKKEGVE